MADPSALFKGGCGERRVDWRAHLPPSGALEMPAGAFLLRTGARLLLVDAGYGPKRPPQVTGSNLLAALASLGVAPSDVTDVLFTHLHADHIGWATTTRGRPTFGRAIHHCHQGDWEAFVEPPGTSGAHAPVAVGLRSLADRFETYTSEFTVAAGVDVVPAPGHTPGSSVVVISAPDQRAVLLGDVVHHPVQLVDERWARMADSDPVEARRTQRALVRELIDGSALVVGSHFPGLRFGRVVETHNGRLWVSA